MKIKTNKYEYTYIPKTVFKMDIKTTSKLLYTFLFMKSGYKNDNGEEPKFIIPNNSELAKKLTMSRPTIIAAKQELIDNNLLSINESNEITVYFPNVDGELEQLTSEIRECFRIGANVADYGGLLKCSKNMLFASLPANLKITHFLLNSTKMMEKDHLRRIANAANIPFEAFKKNFYKLKELGYIEYDVIAVEENQKNEFANRSIANMKVYVTNEAEVIIKPKQLVEEMVEEVNPYTAEEELTELVTNPSELLKQIMKEQKEYKQSLSKEVAEENELEDILQMI